MFTAVPVPEAGFYCPNLAMNKYPRSNFIINNCGNYISENEEFSLILLIINRPPNLFIFTNAINCKSVVI